MGVDCASISQEKYCLKVVLLRIFLLICPSCRFGHDGSINLASGWSPFKNFPTVINRSYIFRVYGTEKVSIHQYFFNVFHIRIEDYVQFDFQHKLCKKHIINKK